MRCPRLFLTLLACVLIPGGMLMAENQAPVQAPEFPGVEDAIQVPLQHVKAGAAGKLAIDLRLPEGYYLTARAPLTYEVNIAGTGITIAEPDRKARILAPDLPLTVPFQATAGEHQATIDIDMTFYYCRKDDTGVCVIQSVRWLAPLRTVADGDAGQPVISYQAEAPVVQKQL